MTVVTGVACENTILIKISFYLNGQEFLIRRKRILLNWARFIHLLVYHFFC